ncbi:MAG TPA: hypothetical protein VJ901_12350 [Thermoanaerobaculia bacterium]|nr:hypothetical protein [Thermoanaerobaculia bacterium]
MQIATYAGSTAVTEGEVCFFRGKNGDPFFDRFLTSGDVRCYPLTNAPEPPAGLWNYYVQTNTHVSTHPLAIEILSPGTIRPMRVELLPAATLDVAAAQKGLRPGEYLALYVSNEGQSSSRPSLRPIPREVSSVLIPADMRVLLVVEDEQIIWASRPLNVPGGGTMTAPAPDRATHDVIVLTGLDAAVTPSERQQIDGMAPPVVRLVGKGRTFTPAFELRRAPQFDTSIVEFLDVPPGEYDATASGAYWLPDHAPVTVHSPSTAIAQPKRLIVTRPCARIEIRWQVPHPLTQSHQASCGADTPEQTSLRVARCAFGFGRGALQDCVAVHDEQLHTDSGERVLDMLSPGDYTVTLSHGGMSTRQMISTRASQTAAVDIALAPGRIRGRVTRSGSPIAAVVTFASGSTHTDRNGDYDAFVEDAPGERPVVVTPCDTQREYVDVPPRPLLGDDHYDIDIPQNRLVITVVDARTRAPLPNSSVTSRIITADHTVSSRILSMTDAKGTVSDEVISENVTLEICSRHPGYEGACIRDIRMHDSQQAATIALQPPAGRMVRIDAHPPIGPGRVYTVLGHRIIGNTVIEQDQTIWLDPGSGPGAMLYVVALNYPLMRIPVPDLSDELVLRLPRASPVMRTVTLSGESPHHGGPIGLEIDGTPVPQEIVRYLEAIHGTSPLQIRNGETIELGPFDESLHATLLLWRFVVDLPANLRVQDPFNDPRTLPLMDRAPLVGERVVLHPER